MFGVAFDEGFSVAAPLLQMLHDGSDLQQARLEGGRLHGEKVVDLIADPAELATNNRNVFRPQLEGGNRQQVAETEGVGRNPGNALTEIAPPTGNKRYQPDQYDDPYRRE